MKTKRPCESSPDVMAVTMGMDALRLCLGHKPKNWNANEVIRWISLLSCERPSNKR